MLAVSTAQKSAIIPQQMIPMDSGQIVFIELLRLFCHSPLFCRISPAGVTSGDDDGERAARAIRPDHHQVEPRPGPQRATTSGGRRCGSRIRQQVAAPGGGMSTSIRRAGRRPSASRRRRVQRSSVWVPNGIAPSSVQSGISRSSPSRSTSRTSSGLGRDQQVERGVGIGNGVVVAQLEGAEHAAHDRFRLVGDRRLRRRRAPARSSPARPTPRSGSTGLSYPSRSARIVSCVQYTPITASARPESTAGIRS